MLITSFQHRTVVFVARIVSPAVIVVVVVVVIVVVVVVVAGVPTRLVVPVAAVLGRVDSVAHFERLAHRPHHSHRLALKHVQARRITHFLKRTKTKKVNRRIRMGVSCNMIRGRRGRNLPRAETLRFRIQSRLSRDNNDNNVYGLGGYL